MEDNEKTGWLATYRRELHWLTPSQAVRTVAGDALVIVGTIVAVVILICLAIAAVGWAL